MSKQHRRRLESLSRRLGSKSASRRLAPKGHSHGSQARSSFGFGWERLEDRVVLSGTPAFVGPFPSQHVNEGDAVNVTFDFTDTLLAGGGSVGLDPADFANPGTAFNPTFSVSINTDPVALDTFEFTDSVDGIFGNGNDVVNLVSGALHTITPTPVGFTTYSIAVFSFSGINIDPGVVVRAVGSNPLALLSTSDITIAGSVDLSATSGSGIFGNQRIAGAGGGHGGAGLGSDFSDGSPAAGAPTPVGTNQPMGLNPGPRQNISDVRGGGGGAFGGNGGAGNDSLVNSTLSGDAYGDLSLGIQGGSGGAAADPSNAYSGDFTAYGGGGGGGIELGATGNITITGQVLANGGFGTSMPVAAAGGGGGAGGGILLHGANISVAGTLSAKGGDAGSVATPGLGGGGGGGRIMYSASGTFDDTGAIIDVTGGVNSTTQNGFAGSYLGAPSVPGGFDEYDIVINWGDGSPDTLASSDVDGGFVFAPGGMGVNGSFTTSHVFLDDSAGVTVTVTAQSGGTPAVQVFDVTAANVDPVITSLTNLFGTVGSADPGDTVSLSATFTDVGVLDTHTATINWGDGPAEAATVASGTISDDHVYATAGAYDVEITLTDDDGGVDAIFTATFVTGVGLHGGVLQIVGTGQKDKVEVIKHSSTTIKVYHDLGSAPAGHVSVPIGDVDSIEMYLGAGNDYGYVTCNLSTNATLFGGTGDDVLIGGSGNDVLIGGGGLDLLLGMAGMDLLIGGQQSDILFGDSGGDIFVGGDTTLDITGTMIADFAPLQAKLAALDAVMSAWTSGDTYATRRDAVSGLLAGAIFDDDDLDLMSGGGGQDLFFVGDSGCLRDIILGRLCGETVIELPEV